LRLVALAPELVSSGYPHELGRRPQVGPPGPEADGIGATDAVGKVDWLSVGDDAGTPLALRVADGTAVVGCALAVEPRPLVEVAEVKLTST
jgi:hypothetical protein